MKLEEGNIRRGKNSRREKFEEGFREREKSRRKKNSMKLEGKKFGEGFKEQKKSGTKKGKKLHKTRREKNSRREKFEEGKVWRRI